MADEPKKPAHPPSTPPSQADLAAVEVRLGEDDDNPVPPEMRKLVGWLKANSTVLAAAAAVAVIGFSVAHYLSGAKQRKEDRVAALLAAAQKPEDIEGVLNTYGDTAGAANGRLSLARFHAREGAMDKALTQYDAFLSRPAGHPFRLNAELERLQVLEALGKNEEALAGIDAFLQKNAGSYLAPDAILSRARCQQNLGKNTEAKQTLDNLLASEASEAWKAIARERLGMLERKLKQTAAN